MVVHAVCAVAKGQNLGMGRGVVCTDGVIVSPADDLLVYQQHSPNRHLSFGLCLARFPEGFPHPEFGRCALHIVTHSDDIVKNGPSI